MTGKIQNELIHAVVAVLAIGAVTFLAVATRLSEAAAVGLIGTVLGYIFGRGSTQV